MGEMLVDLPVGNIAKERIGEGKIELGIFEGFDNLWPGPFFTRRILTNLVVQRAGGPVMVSIPVAMEMERQPTPCVSHPHSASAPRVGNRARRRRLLHRPG